MTTLPSDYLLNQFCWETLLHGMQVQSFIVNNINDEESFVGELHIDENIYSMRYCNGYQLVSFSYLYRYVWKLPIVRISCHI